MADLFTTALLAELARVKARIAAAVADRDRLREENERRRLELAELTTSEGVGK